MSSSYKSLSFAMAQVIDSGLDEESCFFADKLCTYCVVFHDVFCKTRALVKSLSLALAQITDYFGHVFQITIVVISLPCKMT